MVHRPAAGLGGGQPAGLALSWVVAVVPLEELSKVLLVQRRIRQRRWLRNLVLG